MFTTQFIGTVLLADFISGMVHWLEDAYAHPNMRWFRQIAEENLVHHTKPRDFLKKNWWQSSWDLVLANAVVVAAAWWFQVLTWHVWLFVILMANANQIHKWAHSNGAEKGGIVQLLQRLYVLQTPRHHARHHTGQKNSYYCVITNFLNPILEEVEFWKRIERFNLKAFGLVRRVEQPQTQTVNGQVQE